MTKKDFELIAGAVRQSRLVGLNIAESTAHRFSEQRACTARRLADALATTNPRFDRARFLAACGVAS